MSGYNNSTRIQGLSRTSPRNRSLVRRLRRSRGFTLLELMVVVTILMIIMAIAVPAYNKHVIQAREAVLRSNLKLLDDTIQRYTEDKYQAPQGLDDLVTAGYLREIPKDPFTGAADWDTDPEDATNAAEPQQPGIIGVHSHAPGTALDGTAYSTWK